MQPQSIGGVRSRFQRRRALALAITGVLAAMQSAHAFEIGTGNPDIQMRWDNTVRYNLGMRAESQDRAIVGNPNFDDGDRNFNNGSLVTNRFDVLSEFDFVYKKRYGFRVSSATIACPSSCCRSSSSSVASNSRVLARNLRNRYASSFG